MPRRELFSAILLIIASLALHGAEGAANGDADGPLADDVFHQRYRQYTPAFMAYSPGGKKGESQEGWHWSRLNRRVAKRSSEELFNNEARVADDSRVNALIDVALDREAQGEYREALQIYQTVLDRHADALYRVSEYGIFVPASRYCQYRLLSMSDADLDFYRTLHDPRARDALREARDNYSLIGFQDLVDQMLATSYGDEALFALGKAAMDRGDYEEAYGRFRQLRMLFAGSDSDNEELRLLASYCLRRLGRQVEVPQGAPELAALREAVRKAGPVEESQDDEVLRRPVGLHQYRRFRPVDDLRALDEPIWRVAHGSSPREPDVFTQPVVYRDSLLYRHRNVVVCRSLLNGRERWRMDLGGYRSWQRPKDHYETQEDLRVLGNTVFANLKQAGASLLALDFVTGEIRWAAGPIAPLDAEDRQRRYEAAPAVGKGSVFAPYIHDRIEGDTHLDSAYGVRAFDAESGRLLWDREICSLAPGKFAAGFSQEYRNRIRSFASPPTLHQGTVYECTDTGTIAAMDAISGSVQWCIRYPTWLGVHDQTDGMSYRRSGDFWYPQAPMVLGDLLIVTPVDSPLLYAVERATGKVRWVRMKGKDYEGHAGHKYLRNAWLLGPTGDGHIVIAYSGRWGPIEVLDPSNGTTVWESGDLVLPEASPVLTWKIGSGVKIQERHFDIAAQPMLTSDDRLIVGQRARFEMGRHGKNGLRWWGSAYNMACIDLGERQIVAQRRFYGSAILAHARWLIETEARMQWEKEQDAFAKKMHEQGEVPSNEHPRFLPAARMSFSWRGQPCELRFDARGVEMHYGRAAIETELDAAGDAHALFARAELALHDQRLDEAYRLLVDCLEQVSPQDDRQRRRVTQVLHQVHVDLTRRGIRASDADVRLAHAIGMARTAGTVNEELRSLLALAEAHEASGDLDKAARMLRGLIASYRSYDFSIPRLQHSADEAIFARAAASFDLVEERHRLPLYRDLLGSAAELSRASLPLYLSAVAPLPETVTVSAADLATARLLALRARHPAFASELDRHAAEAFAASPDNEHLRLLRGHPGAPAAQAALDAAAASISEAQDRAAARVVRGLAADAGLRVPEQLGDFQAQRQQQRMPQRVAPAGAVADIALPNPEVNRVLLERGDPMQQHPDLLFVGGRARKRIDNKFELACVELGSKAVRWRVDNIRLAGRGQEPGFVAAFVYDEQVVVHGRSDVIAFALNDGAIAWRYRVPHDFQVEHALHAGSLMILAGQYQTIALDLGGQAADGTVAWESEEEGEIYLPPFVLHDRLILPRRGPDNLTSRALGTGRLDARLDLPSLQSATADPMLEHAPDRKPVARDGDLLVVSDGRYYIAIDCRAMRIRWQRPIDRNADRHPPMRLALGDETLVVLKKDHDELALYGIDTSSGEIRWHSGKGGPAPLHAAQVRDGVVCGVRPADGRRFELVAIDAASGKQRWSWQSEPYGHAPQVRLVSRPADATLVLLVQDQMHFELIAFDQAGEAIAHMRRKGVGPVGAPGRVSLAIQHQRMALWSDQVLGVSKPAELP